MILKIKKKNFSSCLLILQSLSASEGISDLLSDIRKGVKLRNVDHEVRRIFGGKFSLLILAFF